MQTLHLILDGKIQVIVLPYYLLTLLLVVWRPRSANMKPLSLKALTTLLTS